MLRLVVSLVSECFYWIAHGIDVAHQYFFYDHLSLNCRNPASVCHRVEPYLHIFSNLVNTSQIMPVQGSGLTFYRCPPISTGVHPFYHQCHPMEQEITTLTMPI